MAFFSHRVFKVGFLTFFLSISITAFFRLTHATMVFTVSLAVLLAVVFLGIIFDIIGTATTAAKEEPFHAMASDRLPGSRKAIELVRRADQVASFCNDVVGDICGTVSGAIGTALVIDFVTGYNLYRVEDLISMITVGLLAALTVGGKALGKSVAIRQANSIVLQVARIIERGETLFRRGIIRESKGKSRGRK